MSGVMLDFLAVVTFFCVLCFFLCVLLCVHIDKHVLACCINVLLLLSLLGNIPGRRMNMKHMYIG